MSNSKNREHIFCELLTLEEWRTVAGIDPWSFWGWQCDACTCNGCRSGRGACQRIWMEQYYQGNRVSRSDVRRALEMAAARVHDLLGAPVGDHWYEETVDLPKVRRTADCLYPAIQLCVNRVREIGVRKAELLGSAEITLLDAAGNNPFADLDNPTQPCTFQIAFPLADVELQEIQLHIPVGYRAFGRPIDNSSLIAQAHSFYDGFGNLIIQGHAYLLGNPHNWTKSDACPLNCLNPDSYLPRLEIWRVWHEAQGETEDDAGVLLWSQEKPCGCGCCCEANAGNAAQSVQIGTGGVDDGATGLVQVYDSAYDETVGEWRKECCQCCRPDKATIRYKAGIDRSAVCHGRFDFVFAMLATGLLPQICDSCAVDSNYVKKHAFDYLTEDTRNAPFDLHGNPFGTTEGAYRAWKQLNQPSLRTVRGVDIL